MSAAKRRQANNGPSQLWNRREFCRATATLGWVAASSRGLASWAAETAPSARPKLASRNSFAAWTNRSGSCASFPFDDPLRSKVDNNWLITEARIGTHFRPDQQALIREIFLGLHSPEYADAVMSQVEHDGGFDKCAIALFGEPGTGQFEFVLTGRHVTRRCDGDSVEGAAFGGPIFYGHAAASFNEPPDHPGNAYWYQAKRANELFQALDGKQRALALRDDPRPERGTDTVALAANPAEIVGLPVGEMTADQQGLARQVLADLLAPFREADRQESLKLIEQNGVDKLRFTYYKNLDIGSDGVWDVWQVEGPALVWYFRGAPHVHVWVSCRANPV